jgi:signal transduction histidine kinase
VRPDRGSSDEDAAGPSVASPSGAGDAELEAHASLASHQLGEAVVLLAGNVDLLRNGAVGPVEAARGLEAGTDRARRYVDDLLDLLAAARRPPEPVPFDLRAGLEAAREELGDGFTRARATLDVGALPTVWLDPQLGERLCHHLLRGPLAAARPAPLRIDVSGREDGGRVRVQVRDDGEPLAAGAAPAYFAAFAPTRGRGPLVGAGVSTVICRRVVAAHGGSVEAAPAPEGGAVVTFTLAAEA